MWLTTLKPRVATLNTSRVRPLTTSDQRMRGSRLQRRNARLVLKSPLCAHYTAQGIVRAVEVWDHIIPLWKGGQDHEHNLQGLCIPCHDIKTKAEERAGGSD